MMIIIAAVKAGARRGVGIYIDPVRVAESRTRQRNWTRGEDPHPAGRCARHPDLLDANVVLSTWVIISIS